MSKFVSFYTFIFITVLAVSAEAADVAALLAKYRQNPITPNSRQVFTGLGAQVDSMRAKDPKAFQSPAGQELLQRYVHSVNFFAVEKVLSGCKGGDEKIKTAILNQAGTVDFKEFDCGLVSEKPLSELKDFAQISKSIEDKMKGQKSRKLQLQIVEEDLKISAASILHLRHTYGKPTEPAKIIDEVCNIRATFKLCDDSLKQRLLDHTKKYLAEIKNKEPKFTFQQAAAQLNQSFQRLQTVIPETSKGIPESEVNAKLTELATAFVEETRKGPGILLATQKIRDRSGYIQSPDQGKTKKDAEGKKVYTFKPFQKVSEQDVIGAVEDAEQSFKRHTGETVLSLASEAPSYLRDLLVQSPIAVARVLMKQPENAALICDLLKDVAADKTRSAKMDEVVTWGGYIATGISVIPIPFLMGAGWLMKGAAAVKTIGSIGLATSAIGTAASAIPVGYSTLKALDHANEAVLFESSFLTGTADGAALDSAKKSLEEFNKAKSAAIENLALSAGGLGVTKVAQGLFAAKAISAEEKAVGLGKITASLSKLMADSKTVALLKTVKGKFDESELSTLVGHLASMTEATRVKALKALETYGPEKFKQIFTEAIEHAAKKC
jgi:hypothetical protein